MKEFLNIVKFLFLLDFFIVFFCILSSNIIWLYNTQLAFFSTTFIIIGSLIGYFNSVKNAIKRKNIKYEIEFFNSNGDDTIKEDKPKIKLHVALSSFKGGINFTRIIGYIFLVVSFLWLNINKLFDVLSFLFGVGIVPIIIAFYLLNFRFKIFNFKKIKQIIIKKR